MLETTFGRTVTYPILALTWCIAVADLGVSASLVKTFGSQFPSQEFGSRVRLLTFGSTWSTIFGLILLIGTPLAPETFGLGWAFILLFLAFLQFLVGAASITETLSTQGLPAQLGKGKMFRALEGLSWVECWLLFFLVIFIGWEYVTRKEPELTHKDEEA